MEHRILFRVDGGNQPEVGTGHVVRCLVLARKLRELEPRLECVFLMRGYDGGPERIRTEGFEVVVLPAEGDETEALAELIRAFRPGLVVLDKLDSDPESVRRLAETGPVVITLDDLAGGDQYADIAINAIRDGGRTCCRGPDYMILPERKRTLKTVDKRSRSILVSFGGYDHLNLTLKAVRALLDLPGDTMIVVAIGSGYERTPELAALAGSRSDDRVLVIQGVPNLGDLLDQADLAVVAGGLTLMEALAAGVPSVVVCQYEHQLETALRLEQQGAVVNLGLGDQVSGTRIVKAVRELADDPQRRLAMSRNGQLLVDGKGLKRVVDLFRICETSEWDTTFFGKRIARFYPLRMNDKLARYALEKCRRDRVDCLYYCADCHDPESVRVAEKLGFHFVDIRLTFFRDFRREDAMRAEAAEPRGRVTIRESDDRDIAPLAEIARKSYRASRYYFDQNFPEELCERFYSTWIIKSCQGYADRVFVADLDGEAVGFTTCNVIGPGRGDITLVGVSDSFGGRGIGEKLVRHTLQWFRDNDVAWIEVVTQGRNYGAQRLYQKCGFRTLKTELWYHKWFTKGSREEA